MYALHLCLLQDLCIWDLVLPPDFQEFPQAMSRRGHQTGSKEPGAGVSFFFFFFFWGGEGVVGWEISPQFFKIV